jgi:hypothetical protein
MEGTVVDATTTRPIPGAFVIAVTSSAGADMFGSRSSCRDLDVVQADSNGRYRLSVGRSIGNDSQTVRGYAPGYTDDEDDRQFLKLKRFKGSGDDRRASFKGYASLVRCGKIEVIAPKLRPLFAAIDAESETLPSAGPHVSHPGNLSDGLRQLEQLSRQEALQK